MIIYFCAWMLAGAVVEVPQVIYSRSIARLYPSGAALGTLGIRSINILFVYELLLQNQGQPVYVFAFMLGEATSSFMLVSAMKRFGMIWKNEP